MTRQELLNKIASVFRRLQREHDLASRFYEKLSWKLGIPAVALSAITGVAIFATVEREGFFWAQVAAGVISILGAVLSAIQTFLQCPEQSAKHKAAAAAYANLSSKAAAASIQQLNDAACDSLLIELQAQQTKAHADAPNLRASTLKEIHQTLDEIYNDRNG